MQASVHADRTPSPSGLRKRASARVSQDGKTRRYTGSGMSVPDRVRAKARIQVVTRKHHSALNLLVRGVFHFFRAAAERKRIIRFFI